jgi:alpha-D-ribose 1-methylphosphonate 5-triphosphate synthase subunit PhnI
MYVAVKGGERAIAEAHRLLDSRRRGDPTVPDLQVAQIEQQLSLAVARVMTEGSLFDPGLAALAIKQARGDLIEAIFLVRAYRTTLARFGYARPLATDGMRLSRRVSAIYKDLPGGQLLGPTFDYTHRLIDFSLAAEARPASPPPPHAPQSGPGPAGALAPAPRVTGLLDAAGLIEPNPPTQPAQPVGDLTREPLAFPATRDLRLQNLARGDEGFLLALGYSTQRGYGRTHPFVGEIRIGMIDVELDVPELPFAVPLGELEITECEMVTQFQGSDDTPPQFTRGYGLVFGQSERKAMSMALVDRALRAAELGEQTGAPAQDVEFVLSHSDNVQSTGFVEHLKLPHYVDFQSEQQLVRKLQADHAARPRPGADNPSDGEAQR